MWLSLLKAHMTGVRKNLLKISSRSWGFLFISMPFSVFSFFNFVPTLENSRRQVTVIRILLLFCNWLNNVISINLEIVFNYFPPSVCLGKLVSSENSFYWTISILTFWLDWFHILFLELQWLWSQIFIWWAHNQKLFQSCLQAQYLTGDKSLEIWLLQSSFSTSLAYRQTGIPVHNSELHLHAYKWHFKRKKAWSHKAITFL